MPPVLPKPIAAYFAADAGNGAAVADCFTANAIVVDESITTGRGFFPPTAAAAPHDWLQNMGGSIGFSPPVATGAAVACPDRKVICMVGDGSAMYTIQALWTQARESLVSIARLLSFIGRPGETKLPKAFERSFKTISRDVMALSDHASFLTSNINFMLDAKNHAWAAQNIDYKVPNKPAMESLPADFLAKFPNMAMPVADLVKFEQLRDVGEAQRDYAKIVSEIKAAQ